MSEKPRSTVQRCVRGACCLIDVWSSDVHAAVGQSTLSGFSKGRLHEFAAV